MLIINRNNWKSFRLELRKEKVETMKGESRIPFGSLSFQKKVGSNSNECRFERSRNSKVTIKDTIILLTIFHKRKDKMFSVFHFLSQKRKKVFSISFQEAGQRMKSCYCWRGFDSSSNHDSQGSPGIFDGRLCWRQVAVHSHHLTELWGKHLHRYQVLHTRWRQDHHGSTWHTVLTVAIRIHNRQGEPKNHLKPMAWEQLSTCSGTIGHSNYVEFLHHDQKSIWKEITTQFHFYNGDSIRSQKLAPKNPASKNLAPKKFSALPSRTHLPSLWLGSSGLEAGYHSQFRDVQQQLGVNFWTTQTGCDASVTEHKWT